MRGGFAVMSGLDFSAYLRTLGSSKFQQLWPAQIHILDAYSAEFQTTRDVGIELPTGAGKTLIALLIGGKWLESGKKVVILSANKTLARQMRAEAEALGLPVAYMEGRGEDIPVASRRRYQRASAIGIMNYWVYFNQNPVVDPSDLVVMDDAHLAEHCLDSLYSVTITRTAHKELFEQLVRELYSQFPDYAVLADAVADDVPPGTSAELLSFIDHAQVCNRLKEIIDASPLLGSDTDLSFRWGRLRPRSHAANLYMGRDALWLRPYVYPLISNDQYKDTEQALYTSATIGDAGDLSRRLGARPIQKVQVPVEYADRSSGRRLVVMNRTNDDSHIPDRMALALLDAIRAHPKSVWLCASEREATHLRQVVSNWLEGNKVVGHPTWLLTSLGDEIDQFRRASAGHLFVAGRFDGMDFNGDECRIVVLSTMPRAINLQEEFVSSYLRDSGFMRRRLNQRIVQGLGRCTRTDEDFGVCFLADQRFATHFSPESNREGIPSHMAAEIDLAQDLAEQKEKELAEYVCRFLGGEFAAFDADLAELQAAVPQARASAVGDDTSGDEVLAWSALFESENYSVAGQRFNKCWESAKVANLLEIGALHGWHRAKALYLDGLRGEPGAVDDALRVLSEAIQRGGRSSWFNRMRGSLNRARNRVEPHRGTMEHEFADALIHSFDEHLERLGTSGTKFQKFVNCLDSGLKSQSHATYQEALEKLGLLLGYRAQRPKYRASADCIWRGAFGNARELFTFEAKIEHDPSSSITASALGQAHLQNSRAVQDQGSRGYSVRSVVVTHLSEIAADAKSSVGPVKLLHKDVVLSLWNRAREIFTVYRSRWSIDDVAARKRAAATVRASLPKTGWLVRALDSAAPWLSESRMLGEWRE
jgi:hypothetical protein